MASAERWSVRTLRERIDSMLYERTALSHKPEETIEQELATLRDAQRMTPALVMRDPYILDFLGLRDSWQESDLEVAIIREMEAFLLKLGEGFSFVARQNRIQIDELRRNTLQRVSDRASLRHPSIIYGWTPAMPPELTGFVPLGVPGRAVPATASEPA